jgi:deoxyribodipyrimidine photolyase-related protein
MSKVHLMFPNQLFAEVEALDKKTTKVFIEDDLFFRQYKFHKSKLVLHRSSMQSYRDQLSDSGHSTEYLETSSSRKSEILLSDYLLKNKVTKLSYFELVDTWLQRKIDKITATLEIEAEILPSPNFLTTTKQVKDFFGDKKPRMQAFYEYQRRRLYILMDGDLPVGGKWSFDQDNRSKVPRDLVIPTKPLLKDCRYVFEAKKWVEQEFGTNYGSAIQYNWTIDHASAAEWLEDFCGRFLSDFGPYEDAMVVGESQLFHSAITPMLNIGLLSPAQVLDSAMRQYEKNNTPIASIEGYVRQIIGWREYMRAVYVLHGGDIRTQNYLKMDRPLSSGWWSASTGIEPIDESLCRLLETGYSHHIERLMLFGSMMLLQRTKPNDVYEWFMTMYIDAYDWVMVPNVYGMSQYAANNLMTTKPYVCGSSYIKKMSNYKPGSWCYDWDGLYWQFVTDYSAVFAKNPRSSMMVAMYNKMSDEKKAIHQKNASKYLV